MALSRYDAWKLASPPVTTAKIFGVCACGCEEEIFVGDFIITTNEGRVLEDHYDDFAKEVLEAKKEVAGE